MNLLETLRKYGWEYASGEIIKTTKSFPNNIKNKGIMYFTCFRKKDFNLTIIIGIHIIKQARSAHESILANGGFIQNAICSSASKKTVKIEINAIKIEKKSISMMKKLL